MSSITSNSEIDYDSFEKISGGNSQVSLYGWDHCGYIAIARALSAGDDTHKPVRVFDYTLGDLANKPSPTIEGRVPYQMDHERKDVKAISKNGISSLVIENYARSVASLPLIPLIFCVDIEGNPYPTTPETIVSRDSPKFVTNSELRRIYKHVKEFEGSDAGEIAKKTFKFVKVKNEKSTFFFEETKAPWESEGWSEQVEKRKDSKPEKKKDPLKSDWRDRVRYYTNRKAIGYEFKKPEFAKYLECAKAAFNKK